MDLRTLPRRASITVLSPHRPVAESVSTSGAIVALRTEDRPYSLSPANRSPSPANVRPSARVRVPGGIEDISVSLPEPPITGPVASDLFAEQDRPESGRQHLLYLGIRHQGSESDAGEIILPESLEPGHAITPQSPLSPVPEEWSRRTDSTPDHISPPPPAQRRRPTTPPTPTPPPRTASAPTMTTGQPSGPASAPAAGVTPAAMPGIPGRRPLPDLSDPDTHPVAGPRPAVSGATMPFPGDRRAPELNVSGEPSGIPLFFDKIRLFGRSAGLSEAQMINWARFYAPPEEEILWHDLPEITGTNFQAFRDAVMKLYPNATIKYVLGDLYNLINQSRSMIILNTAALGEYQRNFLRISSYLIRAGMISESEQKRMFRDGLHPTLNKELDLCLRFVKHDHPAGVPWDIGQVVKELQRILTGGQITATEPTFGYSPGPSLVHMTAATHQPGAPAYGTYAQPQVKQEEGLMALLLQEMRALREATECAGRRPPQTSGAPQPRQLARPGLCAVCHSPSHMARECPTKYSLVQRGYAVTDNKGYLVPKDGRLPQGEPGMSVLDRFNRYFSENPHAQPPGVKLPLQPVPDAPPRIPGPRLESMYMGQYGTPPQESMYFSNVTHPRRRSSASPENGNMRHESNYYEAIYVNQTAEASEEYDDPCDGVALLFESQTSEMGSGRDDTPVNKHPETQAEDGIHQAANATSSPEGSNIVSEATSPHTISPRGESPWETADMKATPLESLAANGKRRAPREIFDGIEITRVGPPGPKRKPREDPEKVIKVRQPAPKPTRPNEEEAEKASEKGADDFKPQYKTTIPASDDAAVSNVFSRILESEVTLSVRSIFAASPEVRKKCKEFITGKRELIKDTRDPEMAMYASLPRPTSPLLFGEEESSVAPTNVPLREIEVWLDEKIEVRALLDSGSTFIAMPKEVWRDLGSPTVLSQAITVETADKQLSRSAGLIPRVRLTIRSFSIVLQVQVVEKAPFQLLLGRPFFVHTKAHVIDENDDDQTLVLTHPDTQETMSIPTVRRTSGSDKQRPPRT